MANGRDLGVVDAIRLQREIGGARYGLGAFGEADVIRLLGLGGAACAIGCDLGLGLSCTGMAVIALSRTKSIAMLKSLLNRKILGQNLATRTYLPTALNDP